MNKNPVTDIDWGQFNDLSEMTCFCRCSDFPGFEFRSHVKLIKVGDRFVQATQKPCPNCGAFNNLRASQSDPEEFTLSRRDIG